MKLIICGSREIGGDDARDALAMLVRAMCMQAGGGKLPSEILSGACLAKGDYDRARGVDGLGEEIAESHAIPVRRFYADWDADGKAAGPIRNAKMVAEADACVGIRHVDSRGSADCERRAIAKGIPVAMLVLPRSGR
jgi:hypothetical protein